jgi:competence protein ComEA
LGLALTLTGGAAWGQSRIDINTASESQLDTLQGIGPVKAAAIVQYRRDHGPFGHPTELLRVPGIGDSTYRGLCRQIEANGIPGCDDAGQIEMPTQTLMPSVNDDGQLNVNLASAEELEVLPRIGPALAERIVSYRESHGPFLSVEDLDQVSGIGPTTLEEIAPFLTVLVDLNRISAESLVALGLPQEQADAIVRHRQGQGPFQTPADVLEVGGADEALLERLLPLFVVE